MKKIAFTLFSLFILTGFLSIAQNNSEKRKSPIKAEEGQIGNTKITIIYSSPSVNGREIYGHLVPYAKVWRAGANEATTIETTAPLNINGQTLEARRYSFFIIPNRTDEWIAIFNNDADQWGAFNYNEEKDELRVKAKVKSISKEENLTYRIDQEGIYLDWSNKRIHIKVEP